VASANLPNGVMPTPTMFTSRMDISIDRGRGR
jgi:hypothetical protein